MTTKSKLAKGFDLPMAPKRTVVPETAARKFEKPAQQPADSKLRGAKTGVRVVVYLPPDVAEALRLKCFQEKRSASNAASEALRIWLGLSEVTYVAI